MPTHRPISRRVRSVGALAALALVLGLATGPATSASAATTESVTDSAVFNNPNSSTTRLAIQNHIISLIAATPAEQTIRIALYAFDSSAYADALIAAKARGVAVKIIADDHSVKKEQFIRLRTALGSDPDAASYLLVCSGGCVGDNINHDKFYLFSKTSGTTKVLVQSSANMMPEEGANGGPGAWNNAVTLASEPDLYDAYIDRFTALKSAYKTGTHLGTAYASIQGSADRAMFFPELDASTNAVLTILNRVNCSASPTSVHVAMLALTDTSIAKKLLALDNAGCTVHVAYSDQVDTDDAAIAILKAACADVEHSGVALYRFAYKTSGGTLIDGFLHSKYLLIDGDYDGADHRIIWTGSLNYTPNSLHRNDESVLKIPDNATLFNAFEANFTTLEGAATSYSRSCS